MLVRFFGGPNVFVPAGGNVPRAYHFPGVSTVCFVRSRMMVLFRIKRLVAVSIAGVPVSTIKSLVTAAVTLRVQTARWKIIAATDADAPGAKLANNIREAVGLTGRDDLILVLHRPEGFKDWNDQLRNRPRGSASSRPREPSVA